MNAIFAISLGSLILSVRRSKFCILAVQIDFEIKMGHSRQNHHEALKFLIKLRAGKDINVISMRFSFVSVRFYVFQALPKLRGES